jgi:hypothetical protein
MKSKLAAAFKSKVNSGFVIGNGWPDRLFHDARRLLRRVALSDGGRCGECYE